MNILSINLLFLVGTITVCESEKNSIKYKYNAWKKRFGISTSSEDYDTEKARYL
jgi:hypothetical protein